jgi:hypothetical protein
LKCLQLLAKRGAKINQKDENGLTPLDYARMYKKPECVDFLLTRDAIGMRVEDLRPVSEAYKVRTSAVLCLCLYVYVCLCLYTALLLRSAAPYGSRHISSPGSIKIDVFEVWQTRMLLRLGSAEAHRFVFRRRRISFSIEASQLAVIVFPSIE